MSQTSQQQLSQIQKDEEYASKKKKLRPFIDDEDDVGNKSVSNSKKIKTTANKSVSKSKLSTQKKCEVTFSEEVEEIKEGDNDKENSQPIELTPFKKISPSKHSLKSVKEHVKTPFSKVKDNQESQILNSSSKSNSKANQPNFNGEIMDKSASKVKRDATPIRGSESQLNEDHENGNTNVNKSVKKSRSRSKSKTKSSTKSRSKSPLIKIKEEIHERESFSHKEDNKYENRHAENIKQEEEVSSMDNFTNENKIENLEKNKEEILREPEAIQPSEIGIIDHPPVEGTASTLTE